MNIAKKFRQCLDNYLRQSHISLKYGRRIKVNTCLHRRSIRWRRLHRNKESILEKVSPFEIACSNHKFRQRSYRVDKKYFSNPSKIWIYRRSPCQKYQKSKICLQIGRNEGNKTISANVTTISTYKEKAGGNGTEIYFYQREERFNKTVFQRGIPHLQNVKTAKFVKSQLLDELKAMTGERSTGDLSSPVEGKTYLPSQAHAQPRYGSQMNRMRVIRTVRLPLAVGGD